MELRETFLFWEVGVPWANNLEYIEFSCQIAADPTIGKVHEIDIELVKMLENTRIDLLD